MFLSVPMDSTSPNEMYWVVVIVAIVVPALGTIFTVWQNRKIKEYEITQARKSVIFNDIADLYCKIVNGDTSDSTVTAFRASCYKASLLVHWELAKEIFDFQNTLLYPAPELCPTKDHIVLFDALFQHLWASVNREVFRPKKTHKYDP